MSKRIYYVNRASYRRQSVAEEQHSEQMRDFWTKHGFEEVSYAEYKAFGEQHAGPRTVNVYLPDELHTKLKARLKQVRAGNHPAAGMDTLVQSIVALYVKEYLS